METIKQLESEVRSYCRSWPAVFANAKGSFIFDENGERYIDFFAGAGSLNYGHNDDRLKAELIEYLTGDGIVHSLDKATVAKRTFLERFKEIILDPRGLDYKVQFPGPTGTNAVEAALKLARKVTGRDHILSFTNAFHGMTLGSLSVTANSMKRKGAGVALTNTTSIPFDGYMGEDVDTIDFLEAYLRDDGGSGMELPAAVIVETIQAEGGVNVASYEWLKRLQDICRRYEILFIVDDIQVGCGRTGPFFSFEPAGLDPDIVCLSKSLSGYGLPFAITLLKPELDVWEPGEHNGTFRGHNPAFVTATAALELFWRTDTLSVDVARKASIVTEALEKMIADRPGLEAKVCGRGLLQGIEFAEEGFASKVCREAFARKLLIETSGAESQVAKLLPSLTIDDDTLQEGLAILEASLVAALGEREPAPAAVTAR